MITNIVIISLLILFNIILPIYLVIKFSRFRRCHGFNRILKKAYQEKYGTV